MSQPMDTVDDVLSSLVVSLKIKTKEDKRILKIGLQAAYEMGKRDESESTFDTAAWLEGEEDCLDGKQAKDTLNESYNRGYAARYSFEQSLQYLSERSEQNVRPLNHRAT